MRGRPQPPQPPLLASRGILKLRQAVADLYRRRFGVDLDPETEAITTIGAKEGYSHLMWVLLQPGDAALVLLAVLPHPHLGAAVRRGRGPRDPGGHRRGLLRERQAGLPVLLAPAPGDRAVVPPQPDHHLRRPRLHAADGRLRPRERGPAGPRQRLRRARLRRLPPAVDPPGRGQAVRGRAVLDDQVLLHGRLAHGLSGRQRRGRRRWPSSSPTSTTAPSSRSRSPPP